MSEGLLIILLAVGGFLYWRHRREQDYGYLLELRCGLSDAAEKLRERSAPAEAAELERIADNIQDGYSAVCNKRLLPMDQFRRVSRDILHATGDNILNRANIFDATGRRDRTKEALYNLAKRLEKLKP